MAKSRELLICNPRPKKNPCAPCLLMNPSKRKKESLLKKFNKLQRLSEKSAAHSKYINKEIDVLLKMVEMNDFFL